jgi:hypothetical protein
MHSFEPLIVRHIVSNERQVARVHLDTVSAKDTRHLLANTASSGFNTVRTSERPNIVGHDSRL